MPAVQITPADLAPFATIEPAKAAAMIEDALGMAALIAPCILTEEFAHPAAAKAVLRGAILRWNDTGSGGKVTQAALGYSQTVDTSQPRRQMFWPSEIEQLQKMCTDPNAETGAFAVDTVACGGSIEHADICSINFGSTNCSCGAILTQGLPLYGW